MAWGNRFPGMRIITPPGVFQPRSDTWMLADAVRRATLHPRARALDVCTGSGAVAIATALRGVRSVTAIDLHRRSAWTARMNGWLNGVRIRALHGDLFAPVAGERFDLITANPPYVPAPPDIEPRRGDRAWNAGSDGREVIDRLIERLPDHIKPGGCALIVQSSVTGTAETLDRLSDAGLEPGIVERRRGPLGPILAGRLDYLVEEGLLRGPRLEEEVLVIRGTRRTRARSCAHDAQRRPSASATAAERTPAA
jgi:release factor glutamine methyltransferase